MKISSENSGRASEQASLAHAAAKGVLAYRNWVAREELIGVSVLIVIGVAVISLAQAKQSVAAAASA